MRRCPPPLPLSGNRHRRLRRATRRGTPPRKYRRTGSSGEASVRRPRCCRDRRSAARERPWCRSRRGLCRASRRSCRFGIGAFGRERRRKTLGRNARPRAAAVGGREDCEFAVYGVAERDAAILGPEVHRVQEYLRILVGELKRPRLAGIGGLVDARRFTVADAEHVGRLVADGVDIPEIECLGAGNADRFPGISAVGGSQHGAGCSARPRDLLADRTDAAQPCRNAGELPPISAPPRRSSPKRSLHSPPGTSYRDLHFRTGSAAGTGSSFSESADHNIVTAV